MNKKYALVTMTNKSCLEIILKKLADDNYTIVSAENNYDLLASIIEAKKLSLEVYTANNLDESEEFKTGMRETIAYAQARSDQIKEELKWANLDWNSIIRPKLLFGGVYDAAE